MYGLQKLGMCYVHKLIIKTKLCIVLTILIQGLLYKQIFNETCKYEYKLLQFY